MNPRLIILTGSDTGKTIPILSERTMVGRGEACDIIAIDPEVSRKHCSIELREGQYWVFDLMSLNGTFVNDTKISKNALSDGDEIRLANFSMKFRTGEDEPNEKPHDGTTERLDGEDSLGA